MAAWERRKKILNELNSSERPLKGNHLSKKFKVSRQIIVQDIALLRAKGEEILATPQGYIIPRPYKKDKLIKKIVCQHHGYREIEDELKTIIDLGGKILDVIVEHPIYGEISALLEIGSRLDLQEFMKNIKRTRAEPLSRLTEGLHIHTIEVENEESFQKIRDELRNKKYLINEN